MIELDGELADLKRAVAHMDLGIKAVRVEIREGTDYKRLLSIMKDQVRRIKDIAERAEAKIDAETQKPLPSETGEATSGRIPT